MLCVGAPLDLAGRWRCGIVPPPETELVQVHAKFSGVDATGADEIDVAGESEEGGATRANGCETSEVEFRQN